MIPETLVRLNDDWLQCRNVWLTHEDAISLVKELKEDLNWDVTTDGLENYELVSINKNGTADYRSTSGDSHLVTLEMTSRNDWRESSKHF